MTAPVRRALACALMLAAAPAAFAQSTSAASPQVASVDRNVAPVSRTATPNLGYRGTNGDAPDVFLDIPNLSVDEIKIDVQNLEAHIALNARLANLLSLNAGADVGIERVNIQIKGVKAQAQLIVRLDNVRDIIDRTLTTIDRNPQILTRLLDSVDKTVGTVGGVANTAIRPGGVVDRTVGTVGGVANNAVNTVGTVAGQALQPGSVLSSTVNATGQTVQRVVDQAGNVVERTLDASGKVIGSRIVQPAAQR
ncbi:hypothetical protein [Lysobacter humi (ex Lee et al. 2017)]